MDVEQSVITPCVSTPSLFAVFGGKGFSNLVDRRIRASPGYDAIETLFEKCFRGLIAADNEVAEKLTITEADGWAEKMTCKLFDYYKGAAMDDFALKIVQYMGEGKLLSPTEKMSFRCQVATNKVTKLVSDDDDDV